MHTGYIVEVKDLRPHNNADKLQLATFFGETVIVGLDTKIGDIGIYFPCDLQLSEEYCDVNDLCRKRVDGTDGKGYLERDKRNIKAISLRGEKSYGLYAPLISLEPFGDITQLRVGDTIDVFNGHEICKKYIPRSNIRGEHYSKGNKTRSNIRGEHYSKGNKTRKHKIPVAPLFMEHADTEQLAYNLDAFHCGDEVEITLKMHGTSQRTAYLPTLKGYKRTLLDRIFKREGTPIYDWGYVSGTRRTVLENYEGGFYGSNVFREQHSKFFEGKLWKGETVYYEVVGFTDTGAPIMAECSNKKLNDPDFIKQYGDTTVFSYGCSPTGLQSAYDGLDNEIVRFSPLPQSDIYAYRMTLTTEDGDIVEYTPDFMRYRCEQMGLKTVPVFEKFYIPNEEELNTLGVSAGEYVKEIVNRYLNTEPDPIGKTHIKEGVVVRIINRPKFTAYKDKVFEFKVIESLIKSDASAPDIEEAEDILDKDN